MNTTNKSNDTFTSNFNPDAYAITIKCLERHFPNWNVGERDSDVRMARYFTFEDETTLLEFKDRIGSMMRTLSIFVLTQKVPGKNRILVSMRLKPSEASVIAGTEIASYIENEYEASPSVSATLAA